MDATLTHIDGTTTSTSPDAVTAELAGGGFFWLDLDDIDDQWSQLLLERFGVHPLAVEDIQHFGQRPKMDEYDDFTYLVIHGADAAAPAHTIEVHVLFSPKYVVTVHRGVAEILRGVHSRLERHRSAQLTPPEISVLYLVVDELIDSYFPLLSQFDDRIDEIEDAILQRPTEEQLGELFEMKRTLIALRKVVTPQRDLFASLLAGVTTLAGMTRDDERYFRDLYDHLIRISDLVDSYRDLLAGATDTHLSTVSNRLNVVMKQLAIIATVFLPLSFLTGFFGQNFPYLITHILSHEWAFWVFGIGLEVVAVAVLMILFRKRGWLGGPTT
jgi:magnesium transporter